jgi:hypothetical protein
MNLNCTCQYCDNENAYHNGVNYECPDCDSEWDNNDNLLNGDFDDDQQDTNEEFETLCTLDKPFFNLKHGQLYQCKVDFYNSLEDEMQTENITILPLAFEKNKNRFWILTDAKRIYDKYPEAIKDFIEMDFTTIWNDGIDGYFEDSMVMPLAIICATTDQNTIVDYKSEMYDFFEIS